MLKAQTLPCAGFSHGLDVWFVLIKLMVSCKFTTYDNKLHSYEIGDMQSADTRIIVVYMSDIYLELMADSILSLALYLVALFL